MPITLPEMAATEKITLRTLLPPLYEGDQYAIDEVERAGNRMAGSAGFASTDSDMVRVGPPGFEDDDDTSIFDVALPVEVMALLEQSAKKLNKGLKGSIGRLIVFGFRGRHSGCKVAYLPCNAMNFLQFH